MKNNIFKILAISVIGAGLATPALSHEGETHQPAAVATHEEGKAETVTIPDSAAGIWQAVDKEMDNMSKLIEAGTVEDLHHHAFAVRDLFAALPDHSASLAADKLEKVKTDTKFVATLASRLDEAGDSKDKVAAAANFKKMQDLLKSARENYSEAK